MNVKKEIMFSIIVPVYNVRDFLEQCIVSVLNQNEKEFEIILIDDGSTDGSGSLCDELSKKYKEIRTYHKENGGLSSARNYGVNKAIGRYLYFLDSDDFVQDGMFSEFRCVIEKFNFPDIVAENGMLNFDGENLNEEHYYPGGDSFGEKSGRETLKQFLKGAPHFSACGKCFSKKMWVEKGWKFTEKITSEDLDLIYKVVYEASSVAMTCKPYYTYRISRDGSITSKATTKKIMDILIVMDGWEEFLKNNNIEEEICDGINHLLGNVYIYYVLCKLREVDYDKSIMDNSKRKIDYLKYSDGYRLRIMNSLLGYNLFTRIFGLLWWIDLHVSILFKR